jgi:alcohol dehydrogenase YqhD (iron-dependent ADH family)
LVQINAQKVSSLARQQGKIGVELVQHWASHRVDDHIAALHKFKKHQHQLVK